MISGVASEPAGADALKPLNRLQSDDHEEVLDVIDQLRSEGISRYVNLPQLIICGDQSSGKSSALEAISGLDFPRKDNVCTRFATELILRRAPESEIKVSIYPDPDRPETEQIRVRNFTSPTLALDQFAKIVKSAEKAMGVGKYDLPFSKDVLRVEVSGPTQPHLTLVDLPGLYHAPDEYQDVDGIALVESLVRSYMENPRSVMLAVISAKSDIALQKVTAFTRKIDPEGERTLGIITKPDTLAKGSEMEHSFYLLAQNKKVEFRLGWHVLKNRNFEERNCPLAERHKLEAKFLSQGMWSSLPRPQAGIHTLVPRLSAVLKDHILSQLPSFIEDTKSSFRDTTLSLQRVGQPRQTTSEQRQYLLYSSGRFSTLVNDSLNGVYLDPFFGDALDDDDYKKRLRAVVQHRLSDFSEAMEDRGEQMKIIDEVADFDHKGRCIYRTDFVEEVRRRMRRSRGLELPGNFNPLLVGELFYQQARPWEIIVRQYTDYLVKDVRSATMLTLQEVLDEPSVEGVLKHVVNHQLSELEESLRAKTAELLEPQQAGHPITYNHQFVENIQKVRDQHLRDSVTMKLKVFFGEHYPRDLYSSSRIPFCMNDLIDSVSSRKEIDMERFACSEAIDCMQAYYQVSQMRTRRAVIKD